MNLDNNNIEIVDSWRRVFYDKQTIQINTQLAVVQNVKTDILRIPVVTGHPLVAIEMKIRCTASSTNATHANLGESLLEAALSQFIIQSTAGVEWYAIRGGGGTGVADCMEAFKNYICDWNSALIMGDTMVVASTATSQVLQQVYRVPCFIPQDFYGQHELYCVGSADFTGGKAEITAVTIDFGFKYTPSNDARPWNLIYTDLSDQLNKTGVVNVNTYLPQEVVIMSYWLAAHAAHDWFEFTGSDGVWPFDANQATIQRMLWRSSFQEYIQEDWQMSIQYAEWLRSLETFVTTGYLGAAAANNKALGAYAGHCMRMVHETYHDGQYTGFLYNTSTQQFTMRTAVTRAGVLLVTITTVDDFPMAGAMSPNAPVGPNTAVVDVQPQAVTKSQRKVVRNTISGTGPSNTRRRVRARKSL